MLRVGNRHHETITTSNSSIWSLEGKPFNTKYVSRVV